jgi:hypothetical protein
MNIAFARLLRTSSSERHVLRRDETDFAVLELHYLGTGSVQATLIIFEGSGLEEADVPDLLTQIDEVLLPEVRLDAKNLSFTVVFGRVLGAFQADPHMLSELESPSA